MSVKNIQLDQSVISLYFITSLNMDGEDSKTVPDSLTELNKSGN
jgi:hypothetical protein